MTVIAYKNGKFAADSLATASNVKGFRKFRKLFAIEHEGVKYGLGVAGKAYVVPRMLAHIREHGLTLMDSIDGDELEAIVAYPDLKTKTFKEFLFAGTEGIMQVDEPYFCTGQGLEVACGAFYQGATPAQAAEAAMHFCTDCGGDLQTLEWDWKKKEWLYTGPLTGLEGKIG